MNLFHRPPFRRLLSVFVVLLSTAVVRSEPAEPDQPHRTDINPALLYWRAFLINSTQPEAERQYLLTNEWRGRPLDENARTYLRHESPFQLIEQAWRQQSPCDWGNDLTYGPKLLLPGLGHAKRFAILERFRLRVHLEENEGPRAMDEWLATHALSRHLTTDGTLISCLVQFAMENILVNGVAENWFRLDPATLVRLEKGISAAPSEGTLLRCVRTERMYLQQWAIRQIQAIERQTVDPDQRRSLLSREFGWLEINEGQGTSNSFNKVYEVAGGTASGLIHLLEGLTPYYDEAEQLMTLSFNDYDVALPTFEQHLATSTNALAMPFLGSLGKTRIKEFNAQTRFSMLRAAIAYRLRGDDGFKAVKDAVTDSPFAMRRIQVEQIDRGFEIRSTVQSKLPLDPPFLQIFLEKDGPAFFLDGPKAGQLIH